MTQDEHIGSLAVCQQPITASKLPLLLTVSYGLLLCRVAQ